MIRTVWDLPTERLGRSSKRQAVVFGIVAFFVVAFAVRPRAIPPEGKPITAPPGSS